MIRFEKAIWFASQAFANSRLFKSQRLPGYQTHEIPHFRAGHGYGGRWLGMTPKGAPVGLNHMELAAVGSDVKKIGWRLDRGQGCYGTTECSYF